MQTGDFIHHNILLSDILLGVDDVSLRKGLSRGWYISTIQRGLEELALDSFFELLTIDLPFPKKTLEMDIPKNCFNIRYIYLWNGTCCSPQTSQTVWWKRNYNNKGGDGRGYTAEKKDTGQTTIDPYIPSYFPTEQTYYANIQAGKIMFSSSSVAFEKVRIIANGMGGDIGDEPNIPRFFREAIIDFVRCKFYEIMMGREPRIYRVLYEECERKLNNLQNGSWKKAKMRISASSSFERKSINEYFGRGNW